MNDDLKRGIVGEFIGTFFLVFFGCSAVATAVTFGAVTGVLQVAIVFGAALALGLYTVGHLSGGHFNPALTWALASHGLFPKAKVAPYIITQFIAAFVAAAMVYCVFGESISANEKQTGIERGQAGSEATAMIFGGYFPNPNGEPLSTEKMQAVSTSTAFFAEALGTALLVFVIFCVTQTKVSKKLVPLIIGGTLTLIIAILGPATMGCVNPARDLGPRILTALAGWGTVPFTVNCSGWWTVYLVAPLLGGWLGGRVHQLFVKPFQES